MIVRYEGRDCYEIVFSDSFSGLADKLDVLGFGHRRICVVTDSQVAPLYLEALEKQLSSLSGEHISHVFEAGEKNKQLSSIEQLYIRLTESRFDRHDLLIALGGGVVGDMTGFAAATYLRGISFIQVPTTVLAQSDSSIGGKTGVDLQGYKNMVGAFYMPRLVWMNASVLRSLDDRQFRAGFAEVIKHGFIKDAGFYRWLADHRTDITERRLPVLSEMLEKSCEIKRSVVEIDPKEQGERMLLNFGHTLGHAIEKAMDFSLLHGECVSLGMCAAAHISAARGLITGSDRDGIIRSLADFGLPVTFDRTDLFERIVAITHSDKKTDGGHVRFVLLRAVGDAFVSADVTDREMLAALEIMAS